jgi:hypothetical protein
METRFMSIREYLEEIGALVFASDYSDSQLEVHWDSIEADLERITELPTTNQIATLIIEDPHVTDAEFKAVLNRVGGGLMELSIKGTGVSSAGLRAIALAPNLRVLLVSGVEKMDSWEHTLQHCHNLSELFIRRSSLAGIANALKGLTNLRTLTIEAAWAESGGAELSFDGCAALQFVNISTLGVVGDGTLNSIPTSTTPRQFAFRFDDVSDGALGAR